ncbi:hypothetical protein [Lederbergia graminis]|uniref:DUF4352 domain-containing protein n=1 Tax=Lederbergia graminis TaxID=735518 RepID=A0ABW0LER5_9BACI
MKKFFSILVLFALMLFGCSSDASNDSKGKDNTEVQEKENEVAQEKNTFIDGQEGQQTQEIKIGESAYFLYPESKVTKERKVEFIIHGIDYIKEHGAMRIEDNEKYDYLIVDLEVKNAGENNVGTIIYPNIHYYNVSGQERNIKTIDYPRSKYYFKQVDLIPGGNTRGLAVFRLPEGEEIAGIVIDTWMGTSYYSDRPFSLDMSNVDKVATESATHSPEELELVREEFIKDRFGDYDGTEVKGNRLPLSRHDLVNYNLTFEPEDTDYDAIYYSEFKRDENNRIIGVQLTKQ